MKRLVLACLVLLVGFMYWIIPWWAAPEPAPSVASTEEGRLQPSFARLPLHFEPNQGQVAEPVQFLARGPGYQLGLTPGEAVLRLENAEAPSTLRMHVIGGNPAAEVQGVNVLPGKTNYLLGNDPAQWRTNVPNYAKVRYREVYPGVDLVYYGNPQQLEYDFVVAPGADPDQIALSFEGAEAVRLEANGDLALDVAGGSVTLQAPVIYQEGEAGREPIAGRFVQRGHAQVGFAVEAYDPARPLVIDPVLVYATYLGGTGSDEGVGIAVDSAGYVYIGGTTTSPDFPTVNPLQSRDDISLNPFVVKIDPNTSTLIYATYLGGSQGDYGRSIAVDDAGNVYMAGSTNSSDFPTSNPIQGFKGRDAWVAKIDSTGSKLVYSTYLGGSNGEFAYGIDVDRAGNAYVTGEAEEGFPTVNPLQSAPGGGEDAFVAKFGSTGTLIYSTFLGGSSDERGNGIAVDDAGNAYVTGVTRSDDFPTANAVQRFRGGSYDAFVAALNPDGTELLYSTYLGGSEPDEAAAIALDNSGSAYVVGETNSGDFPTANPLYGTLTGAYEPFVARFNPEGTELVYSTYINHASIGLARAADNIAVDLSGNAYVTGDTDSPDFPIVNPVQNTLAGGSSDAFVMQLNSAGSEILFSTYLGGNDRDEGYGIALSPSGAGIYVTGSTTSADFPTENPLQPEYAGGSDSFLAVIGEPGIQVQDYAGDPVPNVAFELYNLGLDGSEETLRGEITTDEEGRFEVEENWFEDGEGLMLRRVVHVEPATKASHEGVDNIVYETVLDNGSFDDEDRLVFPQYSTGLKTTTVKHTTVLFNLVVSIEWDADEAYINSVIEGFRQASNYLYDVANGQLRFDKVAIYDDGRFWDDADVRIYASNQEWPRASVLGFEKANDTRMYMPREWFGNTEQGRNNSVAQDPVWSTERNYRTLGHEFGHYGLGFYDEYINAAGRDTLPPVQNVEYGFMDTQYVGANPMRSEMSGPEQYADATLQVTKHWAKRGMSCWEFFFETFAEVEDNGLLVPIIYPLESYAPGPNDDLSNPQVDVGAWLEPRVSNTDTGAKSEIVRLTHNSSGAGKVAGWIRKTGPLGPYWIAQGKTADDGRLRVLGAHAGDQFYGQLKDNNDIVQAKWDFSVGKAGGLSSEIEIVLRRVEGDIRWVNTVHFLSAAQLRYGLKMQEALPEIPQLEVFADGPSSQISFSQEAAASYAATTSAPTEDQGLWMLQSTDAAGEDFFFNQPFVTFDLASDPDVEITGAEGAMEAFLDPTNNVQRLFILSSEAPTLRNGLTEEAEQAGAAHTLAAFPDPGTLQGQNTILIRYLDADLTSGSETTLRIFRWNEQAAQWELVGGAVDMENNEVVASISALGTYAVFTTESTSAAPSLNSLTPASAPQVTNNLELTLTGSNFTDGATVAFSGTGITVRNVLFIDDTRLLVAIDVAHDAPLGPRDVTVTNPDGQQTVLAGAFEVTAYAGFAVTLTWDEPPPGQTLIPPDNLDIQFGRPAAKRPGSHLTAPARQQAAAKATSRPPRLPLGGGIDEAEPNEDVETAQVLQGTSPLAVNGNAEVQDEGTFFLRFDEETTDDLEDLYRVTTTADGLHLTLDGFSSDCDLYLLNEEVTEVVAASNGIGADVAEEIDAPDLAAGTYHIAVSIYDPDPVGGDSTPYVLTVTGKLEGEDPPPPPVLESYHIYRSTEPEAYLTGELIGTVSAQTRVFSDVLLDNSMYYYQVTAQYDLGESAPSNEATFLVNVAQEEGAEVPGAVQLLGNYPNPFNPATHIRFVLPTPARVRLAVYDVLGRERAVLVEERLGAGPHEVVFDGGHLPGGLYLYRLEAGAFFQSRTMLLVK